MAIEAMDISGSEKIVDFFPWPFSDLEAGESLDISARWIRFNAAWLTLKPGSGVERNFAVQGIFQNAGQNFVLLRQARMDALGRNHGSILARLDSKQVSLLSQTEVQDLRVQISSELESVFSLSEPERLRKYQTPLEKVVGPLTDWNLNEGPSFASFQISTNYQVEGRHLKDVDFVALSQWTEDEGEVFVRLKSVQSGIGDQFKVQWLDRAPSLTFVGVCKPSELEDPGDEHLTNIFVCHETGAFEVANASQILQAVSRAFDAAELGEPLNSEQAISVFSSITGEG